MHNIYHWEFCGKRNIVVAQLAISRGYIVTCIGSLTLCTKVCHGSEKGKWKSSISNFAVVSFGLRDLINLFVLV